MTQVRSRIGTKPQAKRTLDALGLRGNYRSVVHEDTPQLRGMLRRVANLVRVGPAPSGATEGGDTPGGATADSATPDSATPDSPTLRGSYQGNPDRGGYDQGSPTPGDADSSSSGRDR